MTTVKWKSKPAAHDYPAADSYLSLVVADPVLRAELVAQLQAAPILHYKAKDLLRASQLPVLTKANAHVALDLKKIRKRVPLSPVLLVRGDLVRGFPLQVADGYHRVCASHLVDEDTDIPCRMIDLPAAVPAAVPARPRVQRTRVQATVPVREVAPEVVEAQVVQAQVPVVEVAAPPAPAAPVKKVAAARRPTTPRKVASKTAGKVVTKTPAKTAAKAATKTATKTVSKALPTKRAARKA